MQRSASLRHCFEVGLDKPYRTSWTQNAYARSLLVGSTASTSTLVLDTARKKMLLHIIYALADAASSAT